MTADPIARPYGHARRRSTRVRRRSAGLTAIRAGAMLVMLLTAGAIWGLATSPVFGLDRLTIEGAGLTDPATVRATLDVPVGANLVTLDTTTLVTRLEKLPTVAEARVSADVSGDLHVALTERRPILAWQVAGHRYLVDVDGLVIAELPAGAALPRSDATSGTAGATASAAATVGLLLDQRPRSRLLTVGDTVDAIDLDAARRLGSLVPADVGSEASGLRIRVTDADGFVVRPANGTWTAVFGFYTPTLRPPSVIPGQVRLLRSLLIGRESTIGRVTLASDTEGTYLPAPSPSPSPSPSASKAP